jgi:predicted RNA binding protein YcfA (HicA-like mRNA interferase family)
VIAILTALGFTKRGQTGSHAQYVRMGDARRKTALVSVDVHYKEFDDELMHLIVRQSGFDRKQFYGATKHTARKASVAFFVPELAQ